MFDPIVVLAIACSQETVERLFPLLFLTFITNTLFPLLFFTLFPLLFLFRFVVLDYVCFHCCS